VRALNAQRLQCSSMDDNKQTSRCEYYYYTVVVASPRGTTSHVTPPGPHTSLSRHTCNQLFIVSWSSQPASAPVTSHADHSTKQGTSTTRRQRDCKTSHQSSAWPWATPYMTELTVGHIFDPWPTWPISQLTRDSHDPWPPSPRSWHDSITTTNESWWRRRRRIY